MDNHDVRQSFILEVHHISCLSGFISFDGTPVSIKEWVSGSSMIESRNGCPKGMLCHLDPGNQTLAIGQAMVLAGSGCTSS
jgi:hypothetical protein